MLTLRQGSGVTRPMLAIALGISMVWDTPALAAQPARARVKPDTTGRDSIYMRVMISTDAIDRMVRELLASKQMEQTIGLALREASTGEKADSRKIQELSESLRDIARRKAGLITSLQMKCSSPQPHPEGYLGITFGEGVITERDNEPALYKLGAVESVTPGSPAEKAGILRDDVVLSIGGVDARKPIAVGAILKPGARIPIRLQRGKVTREVTVTVEKWPADYGSDCATIEQMIGHEREAPTIYLRTPRFGATASGGSSPSTPRAAVAMPAMAGNFFFDSPMSGAMTIAGATMMPLDDDWRQTLGVDNGILVFRVAPGSPAKEAGLRASDVIVSADDENLSSLRALNRIIGNSKSGVVKLQIIRGGKSQTLTLRWQPGER